NEEPIFDFDPATMSTGVTYDISAVAGNGLPSGDIDMSDFCLSIAQGTPVLFNDLPTASISGDATICNGEATEISFTLTGTGPFSVAYETGGIQQTQLVPTPGTFSLPSFSPSQTVSFTLVSIED